MSIRILRYDDADFVEGVRRVRDVLRGAALTSGGEAPDVAATLQFFHRSLMPEPWSNWPPSSTG